jgi:hypothetical protein
MNNAIGNQVPVTFVLILLYSMDDSYRVQTGESMVHLPTQ